MSGAINLLPGGGEEFSALKFKHKLKVVTKSSGILSPLAPKQDAINKAIYKYRHLIGKGAFGYTQQQNALSQIKKSSDLSMGETLLVRKVLKRVGQVEDVSHARINRVEETELEAPHLANQPQLANRSGLSGVASPGIARPTARPMVSISQAQGQEHGSGLSGSNSGLRPNSGTGNPSSRPPMIPLSR